MEGVGTVVMILDTCNISDGGGECVETVVMVVSVVVRMAVRSLTDGSMDGWKVSLIVKTQEEGVDAFDKVVKVRTTPDAITEGSWGFEDTKVVFNQEVIPFIKTLRDLFKDFDNGLLSELNEMKTIFNQMEAVVEQCSVDKKYFDIQKKEIFLDNDRLLEHIICQDVMNILMHADSISINVLSANNECLLHDNLEIKRLEQENEHLFEM
ncbi:hypothetical protein Tco_1256230 [Tanacetum coccineum]